MNRKAPAAAIALVIASLTASAAAAAEKVEPLRVVIAHGPGQGDYQRLEEYLEANYHIDVEWVKAEKSKNEQVTPFEGLENLAKCDVILSNLYRTWAPPEQLETLKKHFLGKPVVGMRKAHHGFQNWLQADQEVFGVTYKGHYRLNKKGDDDMWVVEEKKNHPLVEGHKAFMPGGGLYRHIDPADDIEVLMVGGPPGDRMPQTWLRERGGKRVFYTRYDPKDLQDEGVRDLVIRALCWAADRDPAKLRK